MGDGTPVVKVLFAEQAVKRRVRELGTMIRQDYVRMRVEEVTLVPVLSSAIVFCADLMREMSRLPASGFKLRLDPVRCHRLTNGLVATEAFPDATGRHVLIVDADSDSGMTLRECYAHAAGALSVRSVVLIDRSLPKPVPASYVGFRCPTNGRIVGYGMDFDGAYRELRDVVEIKE